MGKIGAGNKTLIDVEGRMQTYTFTSLQIEQAPGMHLIFYLARLARRAGRAHAAGEITDRAVPSGVRGQPDG